MENPIILDGKKCAGEIKQRLKQDAAKLSRRPGLAVVIVGNDAASEIYIKHKKKDCEECGFNFTLNRFKKYSKESDITHLIQHLNNKEDIDGIIVQLPLPDGYDTQKILQSVRSSKDVDCFTLANAGKLYAGNPSVYPCTPLGIMRLLNTHGISVRGKHVVIIGRSDIVGKPLSYMMLKENATVTICHSKTSKEELLWQVQDADILISAVGNPNYLWKSLQTYPEVLIDVGISRTNAGKTVGDIPKEWYEHCKFYTPVPGGVGPMTRAMLMYNVYMSSKIRQEKAEARRK